LAPHDPRAAELKAQSERGRRFLFYGVSGAAGLGLIVGLAKMYSAFRGWQVDYSRERRPWERA
jgi:hypothetical protein